MGVSPLAVGGSGSMPPPRKFVFRLSEMASGAFSGTVFFYLLAIN